MIYLCSGSGQTNFFSVLYFLSGLISDCRSGLRIHTVRMSNDVEKKRILDWAGNAFPVEVREEASRIYQDYQAGKRNDDIDAYVSELKFGTGGLRGVVGNGAGRMNRWTVGRATLGFCRFLKKNTDSPSLVIAYDCRRKNTEFARAAAGIAAALGFKVYLFDRVTPTPVLSYAIRKLQTSGGIVITASHNPPEYNGYKVYANDGSQLVGQPQVDLEKHIEEIEDWSSIPFIEEDDPVYKERVFLVGSDIQESYHAEFNNVPFVTAASNPAKKKFKVIFSPLHGASGPWLPALLKEYGFNVISVPEQSEPDPEFSTVVSPNPEDAEALVMCEELARKENAEIFMATDPDGDRLGAGIRKSDGSYELINGNQIGSIMASYLCEKINDPAVQYHLVKTIVTTELQKNIADANGIVCHNTLTGFKYIAEIMRNIENGNGFDKGKDQYLFGGEESYGYLPVDFVRDKDGLAAALLLCEIMADIGNPLEYLAQVYLRYGFYLEDLKSVTLKGSDGKEKMQKQINELRESDLVDWAIGDRKVKEVWDFRDHTVNRKPAPEVFKSLPSENVLQFLLEPEGKLTIRPSGTEPKVKLYISLRCKEQPQTLDEMSRAKASLGDELASISGIFLARTGLAG